jgi:hypothetical protein
LGNRKIAEKNVKKIQEYQKENTHKNYDLESTFNASDKNC